MSFKLSQHAQERMQMTIKYDKKTDALYVILSKDKVVESEERDEGVIVDYNDRDEVVAIEILNLKEGE